jgi:DNA polymerase/3'-5' exonuclease PolX
MSDYAHARQLADQLLEELFPYCMRIEIAGGVRREKPECHDIELVAIPKMEPLKDIFGIVAGQRNLLNEFIESSVYFCEKNGDRQKKIVYTLDINCDLFIVLPPAQWGVIFTIRTGPADFSKRVVTPRKHGGYLPSNCRVINGTLHNAYDHIFPMPEEIDFLDFLGLGWIEPKERK